MSKNTRAIFLAITLLAFILRIALALSALHAHGAAWFFHQASELDDLASSIFSGHGLSSPFLETTGPTGASAFLAPGYPLFIAAIYSFCGAHTHAAALTIITIQSLFGAATVLILVRLATRLFSTTTAVLAGAVWAISPPLVALPGIFWETSISILLLTSIISLAVQLDQRGKLFGWMLLSLTSAAALLTNPALALAVVGSFAWLLSTARTNGQRFAGMCAFAFALALYAPWPLRNAIELNHLIPMRDNLGYELWQGNRPGADGFFNPDLHPNTNLAEAARFRNLDELGYMQEKSTLAKQAITSNPARFAMLTVKRFACFWTGAGNHSLGLMIAYTSATFLGGFCGLFLLFRRNKKIAILVAIPLVLLPLPYYVTHPDYRFRCVIDPLLMMLTAAVLTGRLSKPQQPQQIEI